MMNNLSWIPEPKLLFNYDQSLEDPRDGLTLFGPFDQKKSKGFTVGVIGTSNGISRYKKWVELLQHPLFDKDNGRARPSFLGFETIFQIPWSNKPEVEIEIPENEIFEKTHQDDKYIRVYETVDLYASKIIDSIIQDEQSVDIWFVIVPDYVYKYCRPLSSVEFELQIKSLNKLNPRIAQKSISQPFVFPEFNEQAKPYQYEVNFHNQLKARLLHYRVLTQILRESTIAPYEFLDFRGKTPRGLGDLQASMAWNISTSLYYKVAGRPWKIQGIREGVCYVGLVFKQTSTDPNSKNACCAAQMFLDSGDGVVFKGDLGPWYNPTDGDYHLSHDSAKTLVCTAVETYTKSNNNPPSELFIHGRTMFNDDEWYGFCDAVDEKTNLVGVKIRDASDLKLFRKDDMPILRGLALQNSQSSGYLWTRGYIPRLHTYPGREVPNPLEISISRGNSDLRTIFADILSLTKLNYNTCIYGDGIPVTLKFADAVGEILTAGPIPKDIPLPFKHYI